MFSVLIIHINELQIFQIEENFEFHQESARRDVSASIIGLSTSEQQRPEWIWAQPRKSALPQRSYRRELVTSILVPALLMILIIGVLSAVLCLQHDEL